MNQQESTRAVIVSGLCARRTVKEIMNFANIKKSTVYDVKKKQIYRLWWVSGHVRNRQEDPQKVQRLQGDRPGGGPPGARHQGPRQVNEVDGAGDERFQNNCA
jgi:hypothetical protein